MWLFFYIVLVFGTGVVDLADEPLRGSGSILLWRGIDGGAKLTRMRTLLPLTSTSVMESLLERDMVTDFVRLEGVLIDR
jgi:hypothetical protein